MKIDELIKQSIKKYPAFGVDDKLLLIYIWQLQGLKLTDEQKTIFLEDCSPAETITRSKRETIIRHYILMRSEDKGKAEEQATKLRKRFSRQQAFF